MTNMTRLSEAYPISMRYLALRLVPELIIGILACALIAFTDIETGFLGRSIAFGGIDSEGLLLIMAVLAGVGLKGCYLLLYRHTFYFGVHHGRFLISRGIVVREKTSLLLDRITDIYITRSFVQFLFGIATLEIRTPTDDSKHFGSIEGLGARAAEQLQRELLMLIHRQQAKAVRTETQVEAASGIRPVGGQRPRIRGIQGAAQPSPLHEGSW